MERMQKIFIPYDTELSAYVFGDYNLDDFLLPLNKNPDLFVKIYKFG